MEENIGAIVTSDLDLPQTGAGLTVGTPSGLTESTAPTAVDPTSTTAVHKPSRGPGAGVSPETSSIPAPVTITTNSPASHSGCFNPVVKMKGIEEFVRTGKASISSGEPPFDVEPGFESSMEEIIERVDLVRTPWNGTPTPTGTKLYGSTADLFITLQKAVVAQAWFLPVETSALWRRRGSDGGVGGCSW
jgi:hypothetical protein